MPTVPSAFALTRDPQLAAQLAEHATGATPAWLWSADGSKILWANAVGAAVFGAAACSECQARRFEPKHPAAAEIARLAATLPPAGQRRLERLRGFGASFGGALTCLCTRVAADGEPPAILVVATEPAGPALALPERAARLFRHRDEPLAAFAPDGRLLYASAAARTRLSGATLAALGLADAAAKALSDGRATAALGDGQVTLERLGREAATVLVASFGAPGADASKHAPAAADAPSPAPATNATGSDARPAPPARVAPQDLPFADRRHPLRFVWQMDAEGRFAIGSDEFIELMGPRTTAAFGRPWTEIAAELNLDPDRRVEQAVESRETWSGITVSWPVNEGSERLPVELSGLPVFGQGREFRGYRGFGVCRDIARINQLARLRRERPIGFMTQAAAPSEHPSAYAGEEAAEAVPAPQSGPDGVPAPQSGAQAASASSAAAAPAAAAQPSASPPHGPAVDGVAAAANVVPFRSGAAAEPKAPSLSPVERKAFRELAQELTARLQAARQPAQPDDGAPAPAAAAETPSAPAPPAEQQARSPAEIMPPFEAVLLDRMPFGVLIYRSEALLYANRRFLDLVGYRSLDALAAAGGLGALFAEPGAGARPGDSGAQAFAVTTGEGERRSLEGRLFAVPWGETSALALVLSDGEAEEPRRAAAAQARSLAAAENEIRALKTKLEAVKQSEEELRAATREAQRAAAAKAEFVAKINHEIRTPLNTIMGFAEVMMAERFGPIGNERYRDYLKDIHAAGAHLVSLLNDLLDLSKVETGQLGLTFANVSLNELTQQCVGIMQPQASRARIIIRTSLTPGLPQVVADERSLRQIVLNLLSNSIKFTGPGGQVIVSTAFADSGEAVLRVRDTGVGMSEKDVEAVLEPFRQAETSGSWGSGGTSLGLPLTKALAEANRAHFSIRSAPNAGTLVEVAFPPTRVVAR